MIFTITTPESCDEEVLLRAICSKAQSEKDGKRVLLIKEPTQEKAQEVLTAVLSSWYIDQKQQEAAVEAATAVTEKAKKEFPTPSLVKS